ncbi:hypothetical protein B9N43_07320 [Denitratisoma sp. DHT3]|uniref:glycosyltransferase family 4 protein n=1 Tax=Denitratisoma sp. DHT3 TaxID=1981880 RepID=UPI0011986AE6|nr:glycosyltransferase family 4 protein [Denitratisoma sp. DHT3]QDX81069.1 hypothetical protein B9N43_07320 [Denitratisoma sp. DHT3]
MSHAARSGLRLVEAPPVAGAAPIAAAAGSMPPDTAGRPRVCFVAPQAWPVLSGDASVAVVGGAEVQQSTLARLLAGAGYQVSMICLDYGQPDGAVIHGVRTYRAYRPAAGVAGVRFLHPRLTSMWRAMRRADADIYYQRSAGMLTALVAAFCRRHGRRSIYAGASDSDFMPGRQLIQWRRDRWLFERGLAMVDAVVVQNQGQRDNCLRHYGRAATWVPSCYELPADARPGPGDTVLWAGNLWPGKRPDLFLELARRLPRYRFVLIGGIGVAATAEEVEYAESFRRAAASVDNLELTGFLPLAEAERHFDRAKVVVNTSVLEGMPNTFLQAWARGVPTVAFIDVNARLAGSSIYRVVAGVEEAAAEIERLFRDELYYMHASLRCREYFSGTHGAAAVLERFARVLASLCESPRDGAAE